MKTELVAKLLQLLESGSTFVVEQAPAVAQEIIFYGRYIEAFWTFVCFTVIAAIVFGVGWIFKKTEGAYENELPRGLACIFGGLASLILLIAGFCSIDSSLKAWATPKMYVIQALTGKCKR